MTQHTPGPWEAEFGEVVAVLDKERGRVCTINWLRGPHGSFGRRPDKEGEANARLIAAAPALYEACASVWLMLADTSDNELRLIADECRAALSLVSKESR